MDASRLFVDSKTMLCYCRIMPEAVPRDSSHEFSQQAAEDIYNRLQEQRGRVSLSGFDRGEVIYPEEDLRIKIARLDASYDLEREMFRKRGFTDEDIASGITAVIEYEFRNPQWPKEPFRDEPQIRYLNVSNTGKIVTGDCDRPYHPTALTPPDVDAFKRVAQLSMIPRQILEVFGSYDEFSHALGHRDMAGIEYTDMSPTQILYNGGLRAFVEALQLKSQGQLGRLDTSLHQLRDSLDRRSHFEKLFDILERFQDGQ